MIVSHSRKQWGPWLS